jgi:GT2 family glycosyltransferase
MPSAISIVVTVRDDREGLAELLPALAAQRHPAEEIVIVDAGSSDGSEDLLAYWRDRGLPLRILCEPGVGISAGRNLGVAAATHERIAITDAGCRPAPGWLEVLVRELEECDFVAGTYTVDRETPFEHAVAVSLYPDVSEVRKDLSLPERAWHRAFGRSFQVDRATGRSMAFTRACWETAGGFPERVNAGEDVAFSKAALASGARSTLAPDAIVAWRGRRTWRANARMYWHYAEGDAILGAQPRAFLRGGAWTLAMLLALLDGWRGRTVVLIGAGVYASLPAARAYRTGLPMRHWWRIVVVLAMKDLAMLGGTASGLRGGGAARSVKLTAREWAELQAADPSSATTAS